MEKDEPNQGPNYIHIYPFRFVQPYPHVYRTFAKGRWVAMQLLATMIKEFKAYPAEYYENAIKNGNILVNNKQVEPSYVFKNGDQITHTSIRVEPPVLDLPIKIIEQTEDYLIICKPPSIIVHTGGGHHYNTVQNLLKFEYGYKNIHVLHRLDKCTSGLLIFAKDKSKVGLFHQQSENETMKKMYFARVGGEVEWEEKVLSAYIQCISHKDGVYKVIGQIKQEQKQEVKLQKKAQLQQNNQKQKQQSEGNKEQKQKVILQKQEKQVKKQMSKQATKQKKNRKQQSTNSDIKDSKTVFKKVWYDKQTDSSLLECYPITGRTHQIRVHLQYLGYPILNDTCYGGRFVGNGIIKYIQGKYAHKEQENMGTPHKKVKTCEQLNVQEWDYQTKPWEIMLHSYHYKFGGKSFKTDLPYWYHKEQLKSLEKDQKKDI